MMYALSINVDQSMELFNITNSMVEGIIEDLNAFEEKFLIKETPKAIFIHKDNYSSIYFHDEMVRKEYVVDLLEGRMPCALIDPAMRVNA